MTAAPDGGGFIAEPADPPPYDPAEHERRIMEARAREARERTVTAGLDRPPRNGAPGEPPGAARVRVIAAREVGGADLARVRDAAEEAAAREAQALVEGVVAGDRVEFAGQVFRISDRVGLMPLMKFAHAADEGLDTSDMRALAAMYDLVRDCIYAGTEADPDPAISALKPGQPGYDAGDWDKFERLATKIKAQGDDLMTLVQQVVEVLTARPTP